MKAPVLAYPLTNGENIIDADASGVGTANERKYCMSRSVLLFVISAVKHCHHYLYWRHFTIRSAHRVLKW